MKSQNRLKSIISFFIAALLLIQNFSFAPELGKAQSVLDSVREKAQSTGYAHLEVLRDSEGNANITEDSITWKLVYNSSKENRQETKLELNLSLGQELMYKDGSGNLDFLSQPKFLNEKFSTFDSALKDFALDESLLLPEQINNQDIVSSFEYVDKGKYTLNFKPTEEVQEVIFTTKLTDLNTTDYYTYTLFSFEENEYQTNAEVTLKSREKKNIDVNLLWSNIADNIEVPDAIIRLKDGEGIEVETKTVPSSQSVVSFESLFKYDLNGKEIQYSIEQDPIKDYKTTIEGYNIENIYTALDEKEELISTQNIPETLNQMMSSEAVKESTGSSLNMEAVNLEESTGTAPVENTDVIVEETVSAELPAEIESENPVADVQENIIPTEEAVEPPVIESVETMAKDNMTSEILALAEPKVSNTVELTEVAKLESEEPVAVTNEDVKLLSTTSLLRSNGTSSIYSLTIRAYEHNNPTVKLQGATFKVTGLNFEFTGETDANGELRVSLPSIGTYTVVQQSAPSGYLKYPTAQDVNITSLNPGAILEVPNPKGTGLGTIKVYSKESNQGVQTQTPVAGIEYLLVGANGISYKQTTDSNGYAVFTNLPTNTTYTLYQSKLPFEYSSPTPPVEVKINEFAFPEFLNIVQVWNDKKITRPVELYAHEYGDYTKPISGAVFKIEREDGQIQTVTAGTDGRVIADLYRLSEYKITQTGSDATHLVYPGEKIFNEESLSSQLNFPNKLINPASVVKNITALKEWGDPKPNPTPDITVDLYANGILKSTKIITASSSTQSVIFENMRVYDDSNEPIEYTVKERDIAGYYAVYTKTADGWKITNYKKNTPSQPTCSPTLNSGPGYGGNFIVHTSGAVFKLVDTAGTYALAFCVDQRTNFDNYSSKLGYYTMFQESDMIGKFKYGPSHEYTMDQAKLEQLRHVMAYAYENYTSVEEYMTYFGYSQAYSDGVYVGMGVSYAIPTTLNYSVDMWTIRDKPVALNAYNGALAYRIPEDSPYTYKMYFLAVPAAGGGFNQTTSQMILIVQRCERVDESVDISGTKTWTGDLPSERPESVEVELYKNGVATGIKQTVTPDQYGNWTYIFENQPKYTGDQLNVYTVRETVVPSGYTAIYPESTDIYNYNIVNAKSEVKILKVDENDMPITGDISAQAKFRLTKLDYGTGNPLSPAVNQEFTTDPATGLGQTGSLPFGTLWKLEEIEAPSGYTGSADNITIRVTPQGEVQMMRNGVAVSEYDMNPFMFKNHRQPGSIELTKVGNDNPNVGLYAGKFQLYRQDVSTGQVNINDPVGEVQWTDENGKVYWTGLEPGVYYIKEVEAPFSYHAVGTYTIGSGAPTPYSLNDYIPITVASQTDQYASNNVQITMENYKKGVYPPTGGIGTYIFFIGGMAVMGTAYILNRKNFSKKSIKNI